MVETKVTRLVQIKTLKPLRSKREMWLKITFFDKKNTFHFRINVFLVTFNPEMKKSIEMFIFPNVSFLSEFPFSFHYLTFFYELVVFFRFSIFFKIPFFFRILYFFHVKHFLCDFYPRILYFCSFILHKLRFCKM